MDAQRKRQIKKVQGDSRYMCVYIYMYIYIQDASPRNNLFYIPRPHPRSLKNYVSQKKKIRVVVLPEPLRSRSTNRSARSCGAGWQHFVATLAVAPFKRKKAANGGEKYPLLVFFDLEKYLQYWRLKKLDQALPPWTSTKKTWLFIVDQTHIFGTTTKSGVIKRTGSGDEVWKSSSREQLLLVGYTHILSPFNSCAYQFLWLWGLKCFYYRN